jgi:hypothetical protein
MATEVPLLEAEHRRRLAQILRYIANMHLQDDVLSASFVRPLANEHHHHRDFFQGDHEDLLFTTSSFRRLLLLQKEREGPAPFQFYAAPESATISTSITKSIFAAASSSFQKKRSSNSTSAAVHHHHHHNNNNNNNNSNEEKACWLRLTRSSLPSPPVPQHPAVHQYLTQWLLAAQTTQTTRGSVTTTTLDGLLTLARLEQAPRVNATVSRQGERHIQHFLQSYRHYLHQRAYHRILEPIYNTLFEYVHGYGTDHQQLVWGFGHAHFVNHEKMRTSGPLLEILVEVEMARDGALLIRPRDHTGVAVNRSVLNSLVASSADGSTSSNNNLAEIYKAVAELQPSQLSPAQPQTYLPILKQIAIQLRGRVVKSGGCDTTGHNNYGDNNNLSISEAWCLYTRAKPSSVWARDALALADTAGQLELPPAVWSFTHGPAALEKQQQQQRALATTGGGMGPFSTGWWTSRWWTPLPLRTAAVVDGGGTDNSKDRRSTILALPASDAQNRIADLLLHKNYPVVVCEGPPGECHPL